MREKRCFNHSEVDCTRTKVNEQIGRNLRTLSSSFHDLPILTDRAENVHLSGKGKTFNSDERERVEAMKNFRASKMLHREDKNLFKKNFFSCIQNL